MNPPFPLPSPKQKDRTAPGSRFPRSIGRWGPQSPTVTRSTVLRRYVDFFGSVRLRDLSKRHKQKQEAICYLLLRMWLEPQEPSEHDVPSLFCLSWFYLGGAEASYWLEGKRETRASGRFSAAPVGSIFVSPLQLTDEICDGSLPLE
jgi:hypothetical protein